MPRRSRDDPRDVDARNLYEILRDISDSRLRSAFLAVTLGRSVQYGARPLEIRQVRVTARSKSSVEIPINVINRHAKEIEQQYNKAIKRILIESTGTGSLRGEIRRQTDRTNPLHKWGVRGGYKNPRTFRRVQAVTKAERLAFAFVEQEYVGKGRGVDVQIGKGTQRVRFNVVAGSKGLTHTATATGNKLSTLMLLNFGREQAEGGVVRAKFGKHLWFVPGDAPLKQIQRGQGKRLAMKIGNKEYDPISKSYVYTANPLRFSASLRRRMQRQYDIEMTGQGGKVTQNPITRDDIESDISQGARGGRQFKRFGNVLSTVGKRMRYRQTGWAHGLSSAQRKFLASRLRPQTHRSLMRYGRIDRKLQVQPPGVKVVPKARHVAITQEELKIDGKNLFERVFSPKTRDKFRDELGKIIAEVLQRRTRKSLYTFDYTIDVGRSGEDILMFPREYARYPNYHPTTREEAKFLRKHYGRGKVPKLVPEFSEEQLHRRTFRRQHLTRFNEDRSTTVQGLVERFEKHHRPQPVVPQPPKLSEEARRAMIRLARANGGIDDVQKKLQQANREMLQQIRAHPLIANNPKARKAFNDSIYNMYKETGQVADFRSRLNAILRQTIALFKKA